MSSLAVVILAAGLGKRMHSQLSKVLHPLLGQPLLGHVLDAAAALGPQKLVVVTGHARAQVEAYVAVWTQQAGAKLPAGVVPVCIEQPFQGGTGHAVSCAKPGWEGADEVLVLYGDTPLLTAATLQALRQARGERPMSLLVGEIPDPTGYGRVILDEQGCIQEVVEHKDASPEQLKVRLINAGMMSGDAHFFADYLPRIQSNNAQGEYYLPDLLSMAAAEGRPGIAHVLPDHREIQGVNNRVELALCGQILRERVNRAWMLKGVSFDDPAATCVETGVSLGTDVHLGVGVELRGRCRVEEGVLIERGSVLTDTVVCKGAHVLPYSVAAESVIGAGAHVGPFAHLRPGTVLDDKVKVGNFVETKKAHLGKGAKASHLSYIGDAEIGPDCNIGAGTITCNYDGVNKFRTVLGRGVFIGSDTQLVAPVTLGDEAYVGAGTTVTRDVPAGALIFTRAATTVKEGWVAKKKALRGAGGQ